MTCGSSLSVSISERPGMKLASEDRTAGQRRFIGPLSGRCVQVARFVGIAWPTRSVSRTENCSTCCCGWMTLPGALGTWSDSPTSQPRRTSPGDFHGTGINGMRMVDSAQAMITVDRATLRCRGSSTAAHARGWRLTSRFPIIGSSAQHKRALPGSSHSDRGPRGR
jgi:hypothetical protein